MNCQTQAHKNHKKSCLILLGCLIILSSTGMLNAIEVCKFTYKGSPNDLADTTIVVPDDMVAMSEYIHVKREFFSSSFTDTPSIFFIIDHSSSMCWESGINDSAGHRFRVVHAFMDTLYKYFPGAEVGCAVFQRYLYFKPGDNPVFAQCTLPQDTLGAYIPLHILNQDYNGQSGREILKSILETEQKTAPRYATSNAGRPYVGLKYEPSTNWSDSASPCTHTNAAFIAAKHAFKSSKYEPPSQFIIFISDGDANWPPVGADEYIQGIGVPATFTIFFTSIGTTPESIVRMTNNIRSNNYSPTNSKSNYWAFYNTTFDQLMKFLMDNIFTVIGTTKIGYPKEITINGAKSIHWDSTGFLFDCLFPLTGQITPFDFSIVYSQYIGNDYVKDTTCTINNIKIQIDPASGNMPDTFDVNCWDRNLDFRFNNQNITAANETMPQLQVRFNNDPQQPNYNYSNVKVELSHVFGSIKDKETFTLTGSNNNFVIQFNRTVDSTPTPGNQILEHNFFDSLVATFRNSENPKLPFDTLRISIPFIHGDAINNSNLKNCGINLHFKRLANGKQLFTINNLSVRGDFCLFAMNGKKVFEHTLHKGDTFLTLPFRLPQAVYLMQLKYGDHVLKKQILIQ